MLRLKRLRNTLGLCYSVDRRVPNVFTQIYGTKKQWFNLLLSFQLNPSLANLNLCSKIPPIVMCYQSVFRSVFCLLMQ